MTTCAPPPAGGRPRTRGDLPHEDHTGFAGSQSSPHARGSSSSRAGRTVNRRVVPARAGIFRIVDLVGVGARCRPRTRGDLPRKYFTEAIERLSSPHARGSSDQLPATDARGQVVPARAGIFPAVRRAPPRSPASSPHARGSSSRGTPFRCHPRCRPRTRGDLPYEHVRARDLRLSSPHARGSSSSLVTRSRRHTVVPARAGIFLRLRVCWVLDACRPRTRGDLPDLQSVAEALDSSSPRAGRSSDDRTRYRA